MKIMKKYSFYSLCVLVLLFQSSCLFQEDDLFDEPAAQRLNHALSETEALLVDASNGWIMEYFPTNSLEGYTFLMKFTPDGKVVVASKNKYTRNYTEEVGCWEMIGDNGPVLTFNTFINIFHLFSDPRNPGEVGYNGLGVGGDYEFMVLKNEENRISLKGKKRGTDIVLKRMDKDQNWEGYFTKLEEMDALLFNPKLVLTWTLSSETPRLIEPLYKLNSGYSKIFVATPLGVREDLENDEAELDFKVPFIVTDYGFRLAQPMKVGEDYVQMFKLSENKDYMYAEEESDVKITGVTDLANFFVSNREVVWIFDEASLSSDMKLIYERIVNSTKGTYANVSDVSLAIAYTPALPISSFSLRLIIARNNGAPTLYGNLDLSPTIEDGAFSFSSTRRGDSNGDAFYNRIDGYKEMLELLSTSFSISTTSPLNPADIAFTGTAGNISFQTFR